MNNSLYVDACLGNDYRNWVTYRDSRLWNGGVKVDYISVSIMMQLALLSPCHSNIPGIDIVTAYVVRHTQRAMEFMRVIYPSKQRERFRDVNMSIIFHDLLY